MTGPALSKLMADKSKRTPVPQRARLARSSDDQLAFDQIQDRIALKGAVTITNLTQLIYASQPFGYDSATLGSILIDARRCNARDGITGALICRHDIYLQLLEGPDEQVNATYERICRDDRHAGIVKLVSRHVNSPMFGGWAMLHDPEKSVIWTQEEIATGIIERTPQADVVEMFQSISKGAGRQHP